MAAANPLDYFDTTELDESAVSALVGSLESQLASPTHKDIAQSLSETSVNNNHISSVSTPTVCSSAYNIVQTTNVTPGLKGLSLPNSVTLNNTNSQPAKLANSDSQIIGINSIINSTNASSPSIINAQNNSVPNANRNPHTQVVGVLPPNSHSQNIVNARSSPIPQVNSMTFTNNISGASKSPQIDLNSTSRPQNLNKVIVSKPGDPASVLHTLDSSTSNQKAVILPQVVSGVSGLVVSPSLSSPHDTGIKPGQIIVKREHANAAGFNVKQESSSSVKPEPSIITSQSPHFVLKQEQKATGSPNSSVKQESAIQTIQVPGTQHVQVPMSGNHIAQTNVHIVNAPIKGHGSVSNNSSVIHVRTPGPVQPGQVVMRPQIITTQAPQSSSAPMQVVNVCSSNVVPKVTQSQSKVVQARMAAASRSPQINIAPRPGSTGTITIPHGMFGPQGAMLMRGEQGQILMVTANQQGMPQTVTTTPTSSTTGHRIQYVRPPPGTSQSHQRPPGTQIVAIQQPSGQAGPQTVLRQTVPSSAAQPLSTTSVSSSASQIVHTVVRNSNPNMQQSIGAQHSSSSQPSSSQSQPQSLDNVKKCKNFLSTLLKLAASQPTETVKNVRQLIQGLIDGKVEPEAFTEQLQAELKSSPQPYLVPFLKKSLPLLRQSLIQNKMTIDGVRPPPITVLQQQPPTSSVAVTSLGLPNQIPAHIIQAGKAQLAQIQIPQRKSPHNSNNARTVGGIPKTVVAIAGIKGHPHGAVPSTVNAAAHPGTSRSHGAPSSHREKRKFDSLKDDDDINDVATMGGVNLSEESKNILAGNADYIGTQIRSCKDEAFLQHGALLSRMSAIAKKHGVDDISSEVVNLVSHATQERLRDVVEKLANIAEHRIEIYKMNDKFEVTKDVKTQLKFIEELDKIEKKRHEEQEWEKIMKAAKSRSKHEDPDQQKIKQRAKEMQQAEIERMRQEEANQTALAAIGPRKKRKTDFGDVGQGNSSGVNGIGSSSSRSTLSRPRIKRVTLRDVLFLMEQERSMTKSKLLYKTFLK